jgi:hypothetical protein
MIRNIRLERCRGNGKKAYENDGNECEKYHDVALLLCRFGCPAR